MLKDFQVQKLRHLFKIIDFDHNGLLQKSDLIGIADNIDIFTGLLDGNKGNATLRDDADKIWRIIQDYFKNPNLDKITVEEWIDFIEYHFSGSDMRLVNENIKAVVVRLREVFDKNLDQRISRLEFMTIFVSFRVEVRYANQCFFSIDTNQDGYISDSELTRAVKQFFRSNSAKDCGNKLFGEIGSTHISSQNLQFA